MALIEVKHFVAVLAIFLVVRTLTADADVQQQFLNSAQKCLKKFPKLDNSTIPNLFKSKFEGASADVKCYILCVGIDMNEVQEDGTLKVDSVAKKIPAEFKKDKVLEIINSCKDKKGKDSCDTAFEQTKCISLKSIEAGPSLLTSPTN